MTGTRFGGALRRRRAVGAGREPCAGWGTCAGLLAGPFAAALVRGGAIADRQRMLHGWMMRASGLGLVVVGVAACAWQVVGPGSPGGAGGTAAWVRGLTAFAMLAAIGISMVVSGRLTGARAVSDPEVVPAPGGVDLTGEEVAAIRLVAMDGRKIEAIKMYREATGAGLTESKQAVDRLVGEAA